jgi:hypothetical protein
MTVPVGVTSEGGGPSGYTYAAVLVRQAPGVDLSGQLLPALKELRFTGWVAPPQAGWVPVVAGGGTVAARRRGVVGVGEALAAASTSTAVIALRVRRDRQLVVVAWESGREVARYVSDPSREPGADPDVLSDPVGAEEADAIAAACGRPEAGAELAELLAEPLDPEDEIESERLGRALRLLGLPTWLVSAWRLPRTVATGPDRRDLVRLRAGRTDALGRLSGTLADRGRRRRLPPPVLEDPPRDEGSPDDLAMWL